MNVQDVIALALVAGALAFAGRSLWRTMSGRGGCHCGSEKSSCGHGGGQRADRKPRFVPLVPLGIDAAAREANRSKKA